MPKYDINIMKEYVLDNFKPGSPLREIILQDKGEDMSSDVLIAKIKIWYQLFDLEKSIEYRVKDR